MTLVKKIAAAAGALTLAATGIAAAASPPEAADKGLTTAEEQTGKDLPVAGAAAPDTEVEEPEVEVVEVEDDETNEGEAGGPVDNHGAIVSAVAHTEFETGREHGAAVSEVARQGHGPSDEGDEVEVADDADDTDDVEADDAETDDAASNRPANAGGGRK